MSRFNPNHCAIPMVYCGKKTDVPEFQSGDDHRYTRHGTPYECLKQGIGAGSAKERTSGLPNDSLQRIKYIGPTYEDRLAQYQIYTRRDLIRVLRQTSPDQIFKILRRCLVKGNALDERAYNSVLLFLYEHGMDKLPPCKKIKSS